MVGRLSHKIFRARTEGGPVARSFVVDGAQPESGGGNQDAGGVAGTNRRRGQRLDLEPRLTLIELP